MNRISFPIILGVALALFIGSQTPAQAQKVELQNGNTVMVKDGQVMVRGAGGKPAPAPKGTYPTKDGRVLVVGNNGKLESIGKGGDKPGKGKKEPESEKIRNEELTLKDGRPAAIRDGRFYIAPSVRLRNAMEKASKGTYKTKDGRKIKVEGGGKVVSIKKN